MLKYAIILVLFGITIAAPATEIKASPLSAAAQHINTAHIDGALTAEGEQQPSPIIAASVVADHSGLADTGPRISSNAAGSAGPVPSLGLTPTAKQLLIAELPLVKTPASTAKLTSLGATSFVAPISPLAYAAAPTILAPYPAWSGLAALPTSYSIEQHGYHIAY